MLQIYSEKQRSTLVAVLCMLAPAGYPSGFLCWQCPLPVLLVQSACAPGCASMTCYMVQSLLQAAVGCSHNSVVLSAVSRVAGGVVQGHGWRSGRAAGGRGVLGCLSCGTAITCLDARSPRPCSRHGLFTLALTCGAQQYYCSSRTVKQSSSGWIQLDQAI